MLGQEKQRSEKEEVFTGRKKSNVWNIYPTVHLEIRHRPRTQMSEPVPGTRSGTLITKVGIDSRLTPGCHLTDSHVIDPEVPDRLGRTRPGRLKDSGPLRRLLVRGSEGQSH